MYKSKKATVKRKPLLVWGLVLVVMMTTAVGDIKANGGDGSGSAEDTVYSFKFNKDERIRDALRVLAAKYQKNIVPSLEVDGILAFTTLVDVTFEDAMDAVLGGRFEYEEKKNLIEVFPTGDESRMKYAIFALNYITAAEAKRLITPTLSGKGQVGVTSAAETGVPTGESISAGTGGGDTMSLQDTIVVYDYAENIKRAKEVITAIDVRPMQVLVEATILSASLTEDTQFGIDWQTLKGSAVSEVGTITQKSPDFFKSVAGATAVTLSGGMTIGLAIDDIAAFIEAIEKVTDVTILANPKILAVNKQLGQVYIGDKIGYREGDTFDTAGNLKEGEVKFLDTGTKLSFRPYIGNDGYIRMDIHSKDSSGSLSEGIPSEESAELVSNVMVEDGGTVVIGGMFRDKVTTTKTQIPLLGDLPIVGAVFRGTSDKVERQEVVVLLTPHIIEEPEETGGKARAADVGRKRQGAHKGQQWAGRARLAEDRYASAARYYIEGDNESALREVKTSLALRPTYLEAIRLQEKIIGEVDPNEAARMERVVLEDIEQEETENWRRR